MPTYADVCVLTYADVCRCSEHAGGIAASQARGGAQVADLRALLATCEHEAAAARRLLTVTTVLAFLVQKYMY